MASKRSPRPSKVQAPWRKVTMMLPRDLAKRLNLLAIARETTIGTLAAPAIRSMLAGSHFVDTAAEQMPAIADVHQLGVQQVDLVDHKGVRVGLEPEDERKAS